MYGLPSNFLLADSIQTSSSFQITTQTKNNFPSAQNVWVSSKECWKMLIFATSGTKQTRTVKIMLCVVRKIKCDTGHRTQHTLGDAAAAQGASCSPTSPRDVKKNCTVFLFPRGDNCDSEKLLSLWPGGTQLRWSVASTPRTPKHIN